MSNQIQVGRARGVDTSALEAQYNGLNVYLEGLEAARAYNKATQSETSTQPTDGRVSEQEFSRSPAMVQQYGTYQNYLKAARQNQVATVEPKRDSRFSHSSGSTERQNVLKRVWNAALGGLMQSGGTSMDAAGAMYQAGQGGRNTTYNESRAWFQDQLDSELRTLNSMLLENRDNPGTYTQAEIKNQRRIVAEA